MRIHPIDYYLVNYLKKKIRSKFIIIFFMVCREGKSGTIGKNQER